MVLWMVMLMLIDWWSHQVPVTASRSVVTWEYVLVNNCRRGYRAMVTSVLARSSTKEGPDHSHLETPLSVTASPHRLHHHTVAIDVIAILIAIDQHHRQHAMYLDKVNPLRLLRHVVQSGQRLVKVVDVCAVSSHHRCLFITINTKPFTLVMIKPAWRRYHQKKPRNLACKRSWWFGGDSDCDSGNTEIE